MRVRNYYWFCIKHCHNTNTRVLYILKYGLIYVVERAGIYIFTKIYAINYLRQMINSFDMI